MRFVCISLMMQMFYRYQDVDNGYDVMLLSVCDRHILVFLKYVDYLRF